MAGLPYVSRSLRESPGPVPSTEGPHSASKSEDQVNGYLDNSKPKLTGINSSALDMFGSVPPTKVLSGRVFKKFRGRRVDTHRRSESVPEIVPRQYEKDSEESHPPGTSTIVSSPVIMAYDQIQGPHSAHGSPYEVNASRVPAPEMNPIELHKAYDPKLGLESGTFDDSSGRSVSQDRYATSLVPCSYIPESDMKWAPITQSEMQNTPHEQKKLPSREEEAVIASTVEETPREPYILSTGMGEVNDETSRKDAYKEYSSSNKSFALKAQETSPKKDASGFSSNEKIKAPFQKWNESSNMDEGNDHLPQYQQRETPSVSHLVEAAHQIQQFQNVPPGGASYTHNSVPSYDMRYSQFGYPPPVYIAASTGYPVYSQGQGQNQSQGPLELYPSEQHDTNTSSAPGANSSMSSPAWVQLAAPQQRYIHSVLPVPMTDSIAQNDRIRKSHRRSRSKSQHAKSKSLSRVLDVSNTIYAPTSVLGLEQQSIPEDEQDLVGGNYWGIISTSDSEDAPPIPIQLCEPPLSDSVPANVEALKPDPEPRNKKRSKYTPDQDSVILELKAAGANWAEIAERANCDNSLAARNRYQVLIGQQGGGTYTWNQSDCEALQSLLDEGERAKWIFIAEEMCKRRNKKYTIEACHYKISQLFAENPEAFEVVRSREKIGGGAPMRHRPLRSGSRRPSSAG
ncbi:hypothetical protein B9G98_00853 [Wickerhamiella sorbophila]|uniref:Myb-like domain-containing protein n=1 Tax=Wickerhamiella sorbophila TaxID=45607 RepID=A0A2T0FE02_9ASCO|nr:hypothetical protein B9G98_00853 [Wickerhamiella sorbophila]PRT53233.1 hypothetical protein B9G98_00853 [Wickerhamiella sorbophila]